MVGAIARYVEAGDGLARDLAGIATTAEVGEAVAALVGGQPFTAPAVRPET